MTADQPNSAAGPAPAASIVIVNWNGGAYLRRCLEALARQTFRPFEVIVADNGSTDGSADGLEAAFPGMVLRVARLGRNAGFAAANNEGARMARGEWLALLNPDAFAEPDWLAALMRAARERPEGWFFASRQLLDSAPHLLDGAGDALHWTGLAWRLGHGEPAAACGTQPSEVFGACAAASFYRRADYLAAGGLDEQYFVFHDDVDLSFRLRLRGLKCLYWPAATVRHTGSAATGRRSEFVIHLSHRNLEWTYFRDMPAALLWLFLPAHLAMVAAYTLVFLALGRGRAYLRAKRDAWLALPRMLSQREALHRKRRASALDIARSLEYGLPPAFRRKGA